jgi:hypothetical protein
MLEAENFIRQFEGKQCEVMLHLHALLTETFDLEPKMRYGLPFYYRKSWICYLNPAKDGTVEFAITRGNELSNSG